MSRHNPNVRKIGDGRPTPYYPDKTPSVNVHRVTRVPKQGIDSTIKTSAGKAKNEEFYPMKRSS